MNSPAIDRAEFLDFETLVRLQRERWEQQFAYVRGTSKFYQRHFENIPLRTDIDALTDLPFTDKEMLRADQAEHPPFGSHLACDPAKILRVHRTSGTTGTAMNLALSASDTMMTAQVGARAQSASGLGPGHRVAHCLNYQLWMGGYTDHASLEATGATVIPFGVGNTEALIRVISELGINAISCTPSYPAVLEKVIDESFPKLRPSDLGLQLGLFGGEAGLDDLAFRARIERKWGMQVRNSNYGVTDVLCNFAGQSELSNDLHFMASDVLFPELIDSESCTTKPWRVGETGELVLTHLAKQCQPLVRFRTGDLIQLTGTAAAACGRTSPRFRIIGRSDDMVVVRGINIFPTMIAEVINQFEDLSGEYRIVLNAKPPYHSLPIEVELTGAVDVESNIDGAIELAIKKQLGTTANVTVLAPHSLPRTEGKTRRVIRTYQ